MSSKVITIERREDRLENGLAPELRFPQFRHLGDWDKVPGNIAFEQISNKSALPGLPILAITQEHGAIPRDLIDYHVSVSEQSLTGYKVVEVGDFIISLRSFQGGIEYSKYQGICSPAYIILRSKKSEAVSYFRHYFKTEAFIRALNRNLEGIRDGKMVSWKQFSDLHLPVPSLPEQQLIAECLSSVDELIAAEGRKLDALKSHKRGLMRQLFPAEGETSPGLRFSKFRKAKKWLNKPLGDLAAYENGKAYEPHIVEEGTFVVVNARFISTDGRTRKYSKSDMCIAKKDDILMVLSDLPNGRALAKCYKVEESNKYAVNQRIARLEPFGINSGFLFYALDRHPFLLAFDDGLNQTHLRKDAVQACPISFPQDDEEQQKLSELFVLMDNLISSQIDEIAALRAHKNGLVQQLFPVTDEVEA